MAATTFHRFQELPKELQMEIWAFAADNLSLTTGYITSLRSLGRFYFDSHPVLTAVYKPHEAIIYKTRQMMMQTYRLSRLIALQAWRRDIAAISVPDGGENIAAFGNLMTWETKMEVMGVAELLIGDVKEKIVS